jgi:hypothetical protein
MQNNLPVIFHHMHCFREGFPHVGYFKSVVSTTKNDSDYIIVIFAIIQSYYGRYILYNYLRKKNVPNGGNLHRFFFSLIDDYHE